MSIIVRVANPEDMSAVCELSDQVFRAQRGGHMADEFPHLYHPNNAHHWYIARDGDAIVGIVGAMTWPVVIAGAATRAASIGSVATDPRYRGRGLATTLLQLAEQSLVAESVRLMLISGDRELYGRFGARAIGAVCWYHGDRSDAPDPRYDVRPIDPVDDAPQVARLYQSRSTRFVRSLAELRTLLAAQPLTQVEQGTRIARIVMKDGVPVAYVIVNHRPFGGAGASRVSEWAGDPKAMRSALACLPDWPEAGMEVPVLPDEWALQGVLPMDTSVREAPVSWLAKVIDGVGLIKDLAALWQEQSTVPIDIDRDEDQYHLHVGPDTWSVSSAELTEWVFGHQAPRPKALEPFWPIPALWPEGLNYI